MTYGTSGNDALYGTSGADQLYGLAGNDILYGDSIKTNIAASADTYIRTDLDIRRNDNYGLQEFIELGTSRGGGEIPFGGADAMRSLLQFNLASYVGQHIEKAELQLKVFNFTNGTGTSKATVEVHPNLSSWIEGNGYEGSVFPPGAVGTDPAEGVAWAGGVDNPDPSADNNQTQPNFLGAVASTTIQQDALPNMVRFNLTSLAQNWVNGTLANYGVMLIDPTTDNSFRELRFWSKDSLLTPKLVITTANSIGGDDFLDGGSGRDTMYGGMGNDTYTVDNRGDQVIEYANQGSDTVISSISFRLDQLPDVENLTLVDDALEGYGNSADNEVVGNSKNNKLLGFDGHDLLLGNEGNDYLHGGGDNDVLLGGIDSDTLLGGDGNDILDGYAEQSTTQIDSLTGGTGFDCFELGSDSSLFYLGDSYAVIKDFSYLYDKIVIHGQSNQYQLRFDDFGIGTSAKDTALYYNNDLIAYIQDRTNVRLNRDFVCI